MTMYPSGITSLGGGGKSILNPYSGIPMTADKDAALVEARKIIEEQNAELKRIAEGALTTSTVGYISHEFVYIGSGGNYTRTLRPKNIKINEGDLVLTHPLTGQIVAACEPLPITGTISIIKQIINMDFCEVDDSGQGSRIRSGKFSGYLEKGDRVILDQSRTIVIHNLGRKQDAFKPESVPNVRWSDIGGLEDAKQQMIEAIEGPHRNREIYKYYNKRSSRGVLLYGPPGCGKTMLGKAAAKSLADIYESDGATTGFMYIKGPEILNKYVGVSEGAVRTLFTQARLHKKEHGYPAIIFIDEADAILGHRGGDGIKAVSSFLVPMFLTEMDGLEESSAMTILATNRPGLLDPAIVRDGRIDRKIKITRPTVESASDIIRLNLKDTPLNNASIEMLAQETAAQVYSERRRLYRIETEEEKQYMLLKDTVNGAMLAGIVDYATSLAIRRDIANNIKKGGITMEDMMEAVDRIDLQARDLNHDEELDEFCESFGGREGVTIKRVKAKPKPFVEQVSDAEAEAA